MPWSTLSDSTWGVIVGALIGGLTTLGSGVLVFVARMRRSSVTEAAALMQSQHKLITTLQRSKAELERQLRLERQEHEAIVEGYRKELARVRADRAAEARRYEQRIRELTEMLEG